MKFLFLIFLMFSSSVFANWDYMSSREGKTNIYSTYAFDKEIENSITLSCDNEYKNIILGLIPNVELSSKENNVVSFSFDNKPKIRFNAKYKKSSAYISQNILNEINQPTKETIKTLVEQLKQSHVLKIGMVTSSGKSYFFEINLSGSSESLSKLESKCKY